MSGVNITIRIDEDTKKQADELFSELGMSISTAFNIFLKQAIREQRLPFTVTKNSYDILPEAAAESVATYGAALKPYSRNTLDAVAAVEHMHATAEKNGLSDMTLDEINEIISKVRLERKNRR